MAFSGTAPKLAWRGYFPRPVLVACGAVGAAVISAAAVLDSQALAIAAAAIVLGLIAAIGRHWPVTIILLWFAAVGTAVDSGIAIGGVHLPVSYMLIGGLAIAVSIRAAVAPPNGTADRWIRRLAACGLLPVAALTVAGILAGNQPSQVRQEALMLISGVVTAIVALKTLRVEDITALAWGVLAAGLIASLKTLALSNVAPGAVDVFSASNTLNAQFGVQRIILVGGDTIIALSVPVGVGLLRGARGLQLLLVSLALPVVILGLVLTYTRTLLGAAVIGAALAWALPSAARAFRWRFVSAIAAVTGLSIYLLNFTVGQSEYSVGAALLRRLVGGEEVGASTLALRVADATAAVGDPTVLLRGRGLGATFLSPITPALGQTGYVHMGYPWLDLNGGLPLVALVTGLLVWSAIRFASTARKATDIRYSSALTGFAGAVATFGAVNVLVNRFDAVEGMVFTGLITAAAWTISRNTQAPVAGVDALPPTTMRHE